jgi:hypothetical protein
VLEGGGLDLRMQPWCYGTEHCFICSYFVTNYGSLMLGGCTLIACLGRELVSSGVADTGRFTPRLTYGVRAFQLGYQISEAHVAPA